MMNPNQIIQLSFRNDLSFRFNVPNILTLNNEVYLGQELLLLQGTDMKIVEVIEINKIKDALFLVVKNQHNNETIELSHPISDMSFPIKWIVISIPFITHNVIERLKHH